MRSGCSNSGTALLSGQESEPNGAAPPPPQGVQMHYISSLRRRTSDEPMIPKLNSQSRRPGSGIGWAGDLGVVEVKLLPPPVLSTSSTPAAVTLPDTSGLQVVPVPIQVALQRRRTRRRAPHLRASSVARS